MSKMLKEGLIVVGGGPISMELADLARQTGRFKPIGCLDDDIEVGEEVNGLRVLGKLADAEDVAENNRSRCLRTLPRFIVGFGSQGFDSIPQAVASTGLRKEAFATLVHPTAQDVMAPTVNLSEGVAVFDNTTLRNRVKVGPHSIILDHGSWGTDASLGAYGIVDPLVVVAEGAQVGIGAHLGAGSTIGPYVRIADGKFVPAGGRVPRSVGSDETIDPIPFSTQRDRKPGR